MKLVKMSLVAAVAVVNLSTASFAETKFSGDIDARWKDGDGSKDGAGVASKWIRQRVQIKATSVSDDKKN